MSDAMLFVGGDFHGTVMDLPENRNGIVRFAQQVFSSMAVSDKGIAHDAPPHAVKTYVHKKIGLAETYGESLIIEVMVADDMIDPNVPEPIASQALTSAVLDAALRALYQTEDGVQLIPANAVKAAPKYPLAAPETGDCGFPG